MVDAVSQRITGAENVTWDLTHLYNGHDDPAIEADMQKLQTMARTFAENYKGKVASLDAEEMRSLLEDMADIWELSGRIGSFAYLNYDTDTADAARGALLQKVTEFNSRIGQDTVFFELEWNKVDEDSAQRLMDHPVLAEHKHYLEAERRYSDYQLSEIEESLLMRKQVTGRSAWVRYYTQLTSGLRFDFDGEQVNLEFVLAKMFDSDRETRKKATDAITAGLKTRVKDIAYIFNTVIADKATDDNLRQYPAWISDRNLSNKAPDAVVDALIGAVTSRYDLVARHFTIKRKLLGLDEMFDYDRYAPLPLDKDDHFYTWEEARDIVLAAFQRFDPRMAEVAREFFDKDWIHAAPGDNKRGGAYASPTVPSAHPYILVNFLGRSRDVSTLAHELGHGIHMALSGRAKGIFALYTPLTTAETASVFAEMLVFEDLMAKESDPRARLAMLMDKIGDTFGTVFRQTSMNRFEEKLHSMRREQGELSVEQLNQNWLDTQRAEFGDSVTLRDDYGYWWSYVGHFVRTPGYVYAYAFGELLVLALYNLYKEQGDGFAPKYLELLEAGDSDYPDKLLAKMGIDLNDPSFWNRGLDAIQALIDQEEALARQVFPEKFA